jgi:hypothetical protein
MGGCTKLVLYHRVIAVNPARTGQERICIHSNAATSVELHCSGLLRVAAVD